MEEYEYPSEKELVKISNWNVTDPEGLFKYIQERWYYPNYVTISDNGEKWEFITGGWSGNEELINALRQNIILWMKHWYSSTASGVHQFVMRSLIKKETCIWVRIDYLSHYHWETECGNIFKHMIGSPSDNGFVYCPYCSKRIVEKERLWSDVTNKLLEENANLWSKLSKE